MRLTETTRVLKRRSTLPKGRNPQPSHFKKFTPFGLLAACIIGGGLLLTTTVQAETLTVSTNHGGKVNGNGISCSISNGFDTDCTESYPPNTQVTLTANPLDGEHAFDKWEGDCTGTSSTITVTMDKSKHCVASFRQLDAVALWMSILGKGRVLLNGGDFCQKEECEEYFLERVPPTQVTLTAIPATGFQFKEWNGWNGACTGRSPTITVTLDTSKSCKAVFVPEFTLTVSTDYGGKVNGNGISCSISNGFDTDCTESYPLNTEVTLTATPLNDEAPIREFAFYKWEGDCTGTSSTITVTMDKSKHCVASFRQLDAVALWMSILGKGRVLLNGGDFCQKEECKEQFLEHDPPTQVTLTAIPATGFQFKEWNGWNGACTGRSLTITVTLDTSKSCKAIFVPGNPIVSQIKNAKDIRVIPLVSGGVPDPTQVRDLVLDVPEGCEDNMVQPVRIIPLSKGKFVAFWWNEGTGKACYSHYALDSAKLTLLYTGTWESTKKTSIEIIEEGKFDDTQATTERSRPEPVPSSQLYSFDLNGDKIDDLVLFNIVTYYEVQVSHKIQIPASVGAGYITYRVTPQYQVALGNPDGSFDFIGGTTIQAGGPFDRQIPYFPSMDNIVLANVDGDEFPDLIYLLSNVEQSYPGAFPIVHSTLYMLKGQRNGLFISPERIYAETFYYNQTLALGDFKEDRNTDVFFAPSGQISPAPGDKNNFGQAYVAFGVGTGTFGPLGKSIDFESESVPPFGPPPYISVIPQLHDVDLDNHLDLVTKEGNESWKVYWGDGQGNFSFPGVSLFDSSGPIIIPDSSLLQEEGESEEPGELVWMSIPPPCDVVAYVVHDGGLNDSLLLSVSNPNLKFTPLGTVHQGYDLEALALDPQTGELYASSGENSNKPGYLYKVQGKNVVELGQPGAFAGGLEGLSFNPSTNILWGWAQGSGLVKFDRIEPNPSANVVLSYKGEIQDLTWSPQGDILYAVENIPQKGKNKVVLWAYHPADGHVVAQCEKELEGWQEVEALQALPNGNLLFGLHNSKKLLTGTIDPNHGCQLGEIKEIPVPYDDIEGIALTACPLTM